MIVWTLGGDGGMALLKGRIEIDRDHMASRGGSESWGENYGQDNNADALILAFSIVHTCQR